MADEPKSAPFSMRLPESLKASLQALADAENRSLTNYVETLLRAHVEATPAPKKRGGKK